jgi:hypothetical protein
VLVNWNGQYGVDDTTEINISAFADEWSDTTKNFGIGLMAYSTATYVTLTTGSGEINERYKRPVLKVWARAAASGVTPNRSDQSKIRVRQSQGKWPIDWDQQP